MRRLLPNKDLSAEDFRVLEHVIGYPNHNAHQMRKADKITVAPSVLYRSLKTLLKLNLITATEDGKARTGATIIRYNPTFLGVINYLEAVKATFPREYTPELYEEALNCVESAITINQALFPATNILLENMPSKKYRLDYLDHIWRASLAISGTLELAKNNPNLRIEENNYERFLLLGIIGIITDELTPSEESLLNILRKIDPDGVNQVIDLILDGLKHKIANVEKAKNLL